MNFLSGLLDKGRSLLSQKQPSGNATVAVDHSRYDERDWSDTVAQSSAVQGVLNDLSVHYDYTDDLAQGIYHYFSKAEPKVLDEQAMVESRRPNQKITLQGADTPQVQELRQYTVGDPYGAAMGLVAVGEKLQEHLQQNKELAEAAKEAQEKQEEAQQAAQDAEDAMAQAQAAMGGTDPGAEGPLTEEQAQAAAALQQALDALADAQGQQQDASAALDQAMQDAAPMTRTAVREGIKEAAQEASDEAAMMTAAGVDPGEVKYMSFEQRTALATALRDSRLSDYARWIGRMRMESAIEQARRVEHGRDVFVDVELGNDLSRVLGGEIAKMVDDGPVGDDALIRFAERRLLQRKFEGTEKAGQGGIFAVVDTSGSMNTNQAGITRDCWAKGITFVLLDSARRQGRDFYAILFSSAGQQRHYDYPAQGKPRVLESDGKTEILMEPVAGDYELAVTLDLISFMWDGGTNFEQPLTQALDVIEERGKSKHDIAFITDDDGRVSEAFMARYLEQKQRVGIRTWGFAVGCGVGNTLAAVSDNVRSMADLALVDNDQIRDVMRQI